MKSLIVYAHQEPLSMNGAMLRAATEVLGEKGEVQISDLYAMGWNPTASVDDFYGRSNPSFLKYQVEQAKAYSEGRLAKDIALEQEKLRWCDFLLLQFPLWWFSMPAIMKGWIDRVLTPGFAYGGGKMFEHAPLRGRLAMLSVTTGGLPEVFGEGGRYGDLNQMLHHVNYGMLAFCGFEVIRPFYIHAPARISAAEREHYLHEYSERLNRLPTADRLISFPASVTPS